jgi:hypothetical protein
MADTLALDEEGATARYEWHDVRRRIARVAECTAAANIFGSSIHRWQLEPPLSTAELCEIENQLHVRMPDDYRSFLLQCSRGGAGPHYGVFALRKVKGRWYWEDECLLNDLERLNEPFPHVEAFNPDDWVPEEPVEDDFESEEAYEEALDRWQKQRDEVVYNPKNTLGFLYLCDLGCALREGVVITGPARGGMWIDQMVDGAGFKPLTDDDFKPLTFAGWYAGWLDDVERQLGLVIKAEGKTSTV